MKTFFFSLVVVAMVASAACPKPDDDDDTQDHPTACTPGAEAACACAGGVPGHQVCRADGSGFEPCTGCAVVSSSSSSGAGRTSSGVEQLSSAWVPSSTSDESSSTESPSSSEAWPSSTSEESSSTESPSSSVETSSSSSGEPPQGLLDITVVCSDVACGRTGTLYVLFHESFTVLSEVHLHDVTLTAGIPITFPTLSLAYGDHWLDGYLDENLNEGPDPGEACPYTHAIPVTISAEPAAVTLSFDAVR